MRTNGSVRYLVGGTTSFDDMGRPIEGASSFSEPIPCLIKTVRNKTGIYEDGVFHQASYEVLVEAPNIPLNVTRVILTREGQSLGEFPLQGVVTPTTMERLQFMV